MEKYRLGKPIFSFVGSYIFSIILTFFVYFMAATYLDEQTCEKITTIFGIIMIFIAYVGFAWREGFRDFSRVSYGAMPQCLWKGGIAALIATSPVLLVILIYYIVLLTGNDIGTIWTVLRILMYPFLYLVTLAKPYPLFFLLIYLITPAICAVSYFLGYKRVKVSDRILYKKKADGEDAKQDNRPKLK